MLLNNYTSERLIFRPLEESDQEAWMPFFEDKESARFMPVNGDAVVGTKEIIAKQIERYKRDNYGLYALIEKTTKDLVGLCGPLVQEVDGVKELEIGYHLLPKYRKQGYAIEAAKAVKAYVFSNKMSDSVISIIHVENIASQKVAMKNGMKADKRTEFKGFPAYIFRAVK
jgi:[ribosomal protein S5]-alanine N-acetyltransferase